MSQKRAKNSHAEPLQTVKKTDDSLEIMGVRINGTHKREVLRRMWLQRKNVLHVATVNSEFVMEARSNPRFADILSQTEIKTADGFGLIWAARIHQGRQVERITGVELVEDILVRAHARQEKVFLLGAKPGVAEQAAAAMAKKYPGARYGWYEGARTVEVEKSEEASMTIAKINSFEPDYLLVAYGSPWQDSWIEENREYLRARVAIGVGGVLDEWAGVTRRCPDWIDRAGGKWLWRLVTEPWRWKRIIKVLKFSGLVLIYKLID